MKLWYRLIVVFFLSSHLPVAVVAGETEWPAVRTILLESGTGERGYVTRWVRSPLFWVYLNRDRHWVDAIDAIDGINDVLKGTGIQINVSHTRPDDFDVGVAAVPDERFSEFLEAGGCALAPSSDALGVACKLIDANTRSIDAAYALVDDDIPDHQSPGLFLEEIFHAMGPGKEQSVIKDSVLYEDQDGGTDVDVLSTFDKKVLKFLYTYLEPGDDEATVRAQFDKHWHTIDVD